MIRVAHVGLPHPPSRHAIHHRKNHQKTQYYDFDARDDSYLDDEGAWLLLCCSAALVDDAYDCGNDLECPRALFFVSFCVFV